MDTIKLTPEEMEQRLFQTTVQIYAAYVSSGHGGTATLHQAVRDARALLKVYQEKNQEQQIIRERLLDLFSDPT